MERITQADLEKNVLERRRLRRELSGHDYDTPEYRFILDRIAVLTRIGATARRHARHDEEHDVIGYDGNAIAIGDRVELHPATDLWMRGARYGTVVKISITDRDRVKVMLDGGERVYSGSADTFRHVARLSDSWSDPYPAGCEYLALGLDDCGI